MFRPSRTQSSLFPSADSKDSLCKSHTFRKSGQGVVQQSLPTNTRVHRVHCNVKPSPPYTPHISTEKVKRVSTNRHDTVACCAEESRLASRRFSSPPPNLENLTLKGKHNFTKTRMGFTPAGSRLCHFHDQVMVKVSALLHQLLRQGLGKDRI